MTDLPLPRWAYVPGGAFEADADYETLAQVKLLVPAAFRGYVPARRDQHSPPSGRARISQPMRARWLAREQSPRQQRRTIFDGY